MYINKNELIVRAFHYDITYCKFAFNSRVQSTIGSHSLKKSKKISPFSFQQRLNLTSLHWILMLVMPLAWLSRKLLVTSHGRALYIIMY